MNATTLKVEWSDAIATGHLATDNQHKLLIDIINDLAEAIETGQTQAKMNQILNLLHHYTEWHFEREERCMERTHCPMGEKNKAAHCLFIEKVKQFRADYKANPTDELARKLYQELVDWLVHHIQCIDTSLRAYAEVENKPYIKQD
jgi:hemerythrin